MAVHQVLVAASRHDAVTNAALELRSLLRRAGPSEIFSLYYDAELAAEVVPLAEFPRRAGPSGSDVLVFHSAIGEPYVQAFLMERPERVVLVYHNISPAPLFRPYAPQFADVLERGRQELRELAPRVELALAPSQYNADELEEIGFRDVRVAPLVVDVDRLAGSAPDADTTFHLTRNVEGPLVLFVGQLLPHKRPDLLVQAFNVLLTYLEPDAHLVLAGAGTLPLYRRAVWLLAHELNLPTVWFAGRVSDAELVSFYRRADLFVTASEHEGFCVPLLEAMSFDLPVIARAHAAIPETLGGAGLVLPPDDDPVLLAEAMAAVMGDEALHSGLVASGRRRLAEFSPDAARATFLRHLLEVV
ncbi:MAG TPA: glycosyltransferase [Acidimicrobiales bacterium]|nr:glycosyltransferase [Acidimicrobiales bacterium]